MPLSPFFFEYLYSDSHEIAKRSVMIAVSAYSFSLAFGTKFRVLSISLIVIGFFSGGMYGSVKSSEIATFTCLPALMIYMLVILAVSEWLWRHFAEDEDCWFYTIFQTQRNSNK